MNIEERLRTGAQVSGVRSAATREALDAALRREQITPARIVAKREIAIPKPKVQGKVSAKELAIFTRQFSVMIDAGLPLVQCLEILSSQQENKGFAKVLTGVRRTVEGGSTLANALREYPKIFDDLYTNMVEAGETGGILDGVLQRLSGHIEKAVKLRRAVTSALIYPSAVVLIAGGVIFLLLWKVVPIFATLFAGLGVDLAFADPHRYWSQQRRRKLCFAIAGSAGPGRIRPEVLLRHAPGTHGH